MIYKVLFSITSCGSIEICIYVRCSAAINLTLYFHHFPSSLRESLLGSQGQAHVLFLLWGLLGSLFHVLCYFCLPIQAHILLQHVVRILKTFYYSMWLGFLRHGIRLFMKDICSTLLYTVSPVLESYYHILNMLFNFPFLE